MLHRRTKIRKPLRAWGAKEWKITLGVVGALAIAVGLSVSYIVNKDSLTLKEPVKISVLGESFTYTGKTKLTYEDGRMYMTNRATDQRISLMNIPVYIEGEEKLILTQVMSYNSVSPNQTRKLNYFASVTENEGVYTLSPDGRKGSDVKGGLLFDGKNTYIFLEPMTVTWGENSVELEPMSYMTVVRGQYFYYYSAGDGISGYEVFDQGLVTAENQDKTYTVNLSADLLESGDSTLMLVPNPEVLELFE